MVFGLSGLNVRTGESIDLTATERRLTRRVLKGYLVVSQACPQD